MIDYLTEKATFKCLLSPLVELKPKENANRHIKHNGSLVLTEGLKLEGRGKCIPHLINTLKVADCKCSVLRWLNTDSSKKIDGRAMLTQLSFGICTRALPKVPSPILIAKSGVDGHLCKGLGLSNTTALENLSATAENKSTAAENLPASEKKSAAENLSVAVMPSIDIAEVKFKCVDCSEACNFRLSGKVEAHCAAKVDKDAAKLLTNYLQALTAIAGFSISKKKLDDEMFCRQLLSATRNPKFTAADRAYVASLVRRHEITRETHMDPWTYAAHHIIPGDEILKKLPKCYFVSNLRLDPTRAPAPNEPDNRVFDINDAVNCIQLLQLSGSDNILNWLDKKSRGFYKNTLDKNALTKKIRDLFPTPDNIERFDLMCAVEEQLELKIQWHDTHHKFKMDENAQLYKFKRVELNGTLKDAIEKNFPGKELYSYDEKVMEQMKIIERAIELNALCVREVRDRIVRLIVDIRRHLSNFAKDPRSSYPYFVTITNYFYAMKDDLLKG